MNLSLSRRLKVNLGNYESYEVSGQATLTHDDLGYTQDEVTENPQQVAAAMKEELESLLDLLLVEDIKSTTELTEEKRSVLFRMLTPEAPEATKQRRK